MWRPDNTKSPTFEPLGVRRFLQLNLTSETLDFRVIPAVVPNRGVGNQADLNLYGLHYLQQIKDADLPPMPNTGAPRSFSTSSSIGLGGSTA